AFAVCARICFMNSRITLIISAGDHGQLLPSPAANNCCDFARLGEVPYHVHTVFRNRPPRVTTAFPVRIWGVDTNCRPFMQMATVTNVSDGGIQLNGVQCRLTPG